MINLTANNKQEDLILAYLQDNASELLKGKINNGVIVEIDGKRLLNKKDLKGFMRYACEEARKLAEKGANSTCIDDPTVYCWAMHYFEEDSIIGTLYNDDGTEYKVKTNLSDKAKSTPIQQPKSPNRQGSIFDLISTDNSVNSMKSNTLSAETDKNEDYEDYTPTDEELDEILQQIADKDTAKENSIPSWYKEYLDIQRENPNKIVAYRLGDFYEIFGEKAVSIADELSLTLTSRDCKMGERIPMIGFPVHTADSYFNKMRKSHSVIVVDGDNQTTMPQTFVDKETGEILEEPPKTNNTDKTLISKLSKILGDVFIVR